jgi:uncharacterized protein YndB with AHSA1/START domain
MDNGVKMNIEVNVKDRVLTPTSDVFAAIIDPERMSHYFISSGSGPMKTGETVEWEFADVGGRLSVYVKEVEPNRRIVFEWSASGVKTLVTILIEPAHAKTTRVSINEAGWPMDHEGVQRALEQTAGWTDFMCCMKAYVQHGINLRLGRTKEDH